MLSITYLLRFVNNHIDCDNYLIGSDPKMVGHRAPATVAGAFLISLLMVLRVNAFSDIAKRQTAGGAQNGDSVRDDNTTRHR